MDLITQTYKILNQIKDNITDGFSGIGLVAYDSSKFNPSSRCDLRPNFKCKNFNIYDESICDYLAEISDYRSLFHDGFHFIDEQGVLTDIAQYFVPPIVSNLYPNQEHGVRLYSSICGSIIEGVLFISTICSNGEIYIYESGRQVDLKSLVMEERV